VGRKEKNLPPLLSFLMAAAAESYIMPSAAAA
jgi:hypothetical protein